VPEGTPSTVIGLELDTSEANEVGTLMLIDVTDDPLTGLLIVYVGSAVVRELVITVNVISSNKKEDKYNI
jgi:hypothetical protein